MVSYSNLADKRVISYSKLEDLRSCARKYELLNVLNASPVAGGEDNIDFMFGHAVGTGLQLLVAGASLEEAILYSSLEWKASIFDIMPRKKKSFWHAIHAVNKATKTVLPCLVDYEVFDWEDDEGNFHSGMETYFRLELEDSKTVYEGHIDLLMIHKKTRELCVFEIKTNAFSIIHEAMYANSLQVDGYSLFCAMLQKRYGEKYNIAPSSKMEVRYIVYKVPELDYEFLPLVKSFRHWKRFWVDVHSDIKSLNRYEEEGNYPCRGSACYDFFRTCFFFGTCHYPNSRFASYASRFEESDNPPEIFSSDEIISFLAESSIESSDKSDVSIVNKVDTSSGLESFIL